MRGSKVSGTRGSKGGGIYKIERHLLEQLTLPRESDLDFYLQKKKETSNNFETRLLVDYNDSEKPYSFTDIPCTAKNFATGIGEQIGFLTLAFGRRNTTYNSNLTII